MTTSNVPDSEADVKSQSRKSQRKSRPGASADTPAGKPVRVNEEAVRLAALSAAARKRITECDYRVIQAVIFLADDDGVCAHSDHKIAGLAGCAPASVRGALDSLAACGLVAMPRKAKGQSRQVRLVDPTDARTDAAEETRTRPEARKKRTSTAQFPGAKRSYKETPSRSAESLNSESLRGEDAESDTADADSLADLCAKYGAERYSDDVVQAAIALKDLPGLPHYGNAYTFLARGDQDIWAEAVERTITYQRSGGLPSPRRYVETCIGTVIDERRTRREAPQQPQPEAPPMTDEDLDAAMRADPFAEPKPEAEPTPDPTPDPKPDPKPIHPAVLAAIADLGLTAHPDDLQAVFSGVCLGRDYLFALALSTINGAEPNKATVARLCRVALEHRDKDAPYCNDRAAGMTVAERTRRLIAWEDSLEAEKRSHDVPVSRLGTHHRDGFSGLGDLAGRIKAFAARAAERAAEADLAGDPPRIADHERSAAQAGYFGLPAETRRALDREGKAWAEAAKPAASTPEQIEKWRRHGVYEAYRAYAAQRQRDEAVRRDRAAEFPSGRPEEAGEEGTP